MIGVGLQRGEGNSQEGERRKCSTNKCFPALQISLSGEKVFSGTRSLPGIGSLCNGNFFISEDFPYKRVTSTLLSELLLCMQFLKIISSR